MGRYLESKCKQCRRSGVKLFLKDGRCYTPKCAVARREYPPGMHTWRRGAGSDYGIQLREKQKVKQYYGLYDRQFMTFFARAERQKGNTGENLMLMLERRLDHVLYLLRWALSHAHARQLIVHGHVYVDGGRVTVPSYQVNVDEVITCAKDDNIVKMVKADVEVPKERPQPSWIEYKPELQVPEGKILRLPTRDEVTIEVQEQLIVEFCSR